MEYLTIGKRIKPLIILLLILDLGIYLASLKFIVSFSITFEDGRDNKELPKLKYEAEKYGRIKKVFMDAAYDDKKVYMMFNKEKALAIIKPRKTTDLERVEELIEQRKENSKMNPLCGEEKKFFLFFIRLNNLKEYEDKKR